MEATRQPKGDKRDRTRAKLLEAARALIREKGYEHTRLEDIGNGTTRVHFSESYHAFNPLLRALLEKRVHAFISKDNDHLIQESLTKGVGYLRAAKAKAQAKANSAGPGPAPAAGATDPA